MLTWLLRPIRFLAQAFTDLDSPRQLAFGLALGMLVGLVPKGNLTAAILMFTLLVTRVNLGTGTMAALVFTWLGMFLDPLSHRVGLAMLTLEAAQPAWNRFFDLPLAAWSGLNNTVVLGSLTIGLALFYPVYKIAGRIFAWTQPRIVARLRKYRVTQALLGTEYVSSWRMG